eukprot:GEMP01001816.1.p1 GENE.GEMP01001816.1~~GEMP01001816.1.p1  ORF type:complete len:1352 (+),score=256.41 GEMP01001816.1:209-4264(+)
MNLAVFHAYLAIQELFVYSDNTAGVRLPPSGPRCKDTFLPKLQPYVDMMIRERVGEKEGQEKMCPSICYRILRQLAEEEAAQDMRQLLFTDYAKIRDYCGQPLRCEDYSGVFDKEVRAFVVDERDAETQCTEIPDMRALQETNVELQVICEAEHGCTWSAASVHARRIENKRRTTPFPYDLYACKCDKMVYSQTEIHSWSSKLDTLVEGEESTGIDRLVACDGSATARWCKCGKLRFGCAPKSCRKNQCLSRTIVLFLQKTPHLGECSEEGKARSLLQINKELCRTSRVCGFRVDLDNTHGNDRVLLTCRDCRGLRVDICETLNFCDWHAALEACFPRGMKLVPLHRKDKVPTNSDDDHCRVSSLGAASFVSNDNASENCEDLFGCVGEGSLNCKELCPPEAFECISASSRCRFNTVTRRCEGPIGSCATFHAHCSRIVQREWCRVQAARFNSVSTSLPSDCFLQAVSTKNVPNDLTARVVKQSVEASRRNAFDQTRVQLEHYCKRWSPTTALYGCTSDRVVQVQAEMLARAELRKNLFAECERLKNLSPASMRPRMKCDKTQSSQRVMLEVINRQRRFEYHRTRLSEMMIILSEPFHRWSISGTEDIQYGSYNVEGAEKFMELLSQLGGDKCFPSIGGLPNWISDYYVTKLDNTWIPEWLGKDDWPWQASEKQALWEDLRRKPWSHVCLQALADEMMRLLHVAGRKVTKKLAEVKKAKKKKSTPKSDEEKKDNVLEDDQEDFDQDDSLERSSGRIQVFWMVERLLDTFLMRARTFPFSYIVEPRDMAIVICREEGGYHMGQKVGATKSNIKVEPDVVNDLDGCARGLEQWRTNTAKPLADNADQAVEKGRQIGEKLLEKGGTKNNAYWSPKLAIQFLKSLLIAHDRIFPFLLQDEEIHEKIFALYIYLVRSEEHYASPREHKVFGLFISIVFPEAVLESFLNLVTFLDKLHNVPLSFDHGYQSAFNPGPDGEIPKVTLKQSGTETTTSEAKDELTEEYERLLRRSSQHVPLFMVEFLRKNGSQWFFLAKEDKDIGEETQELREEFAVKNDDIILNSPLGGDKSVIEILRDQELPFPRYDIRFLLYFKFNWYTFMSEIDKWPESLLVYTNDYYINRIRQNKMIEQFICDLLKRQNTQSKNFSTDDEKKKPADDRRKLTLAVTPYFPNHQEKTRPMWRYLPEKRCAAIDLVDLLSKMPKQSKRKFRKLGKKVEEDSDMTPLDKPPPPVAKPSDHSPTTLILVGLLILLLIAIVLGVYIWQRERPQAEMGDAAEPPGEGGGGAPGAPGGADPGGLGAPASDEFAGDEEGVGRQGPYLDDEYLDFHEAAQPTEDEWTDGQSDGSGVMLEDDLPQ